EISKVAPTIAEGPEVRGSISTIRMQHDGHLATLAVEERRLNHHHTAELHPDRSGINPQEDLFGKGAQAGMRVGETRAEEQIQYAGQHRVADVAILPRHGPR